MFYLVKTPWWLRRIYTKYTWRVETSQKILYLTFDDGPHIQATDFVLKQLKRFNAKATFFCLGKNVEINPEMYNRILNEGHSTGNHTYSHLNGWKTDDEKYLKDVSEASKLINSSFFRPCYGRITSFQASNLKPVMNNAEPEIIMWDVISGDFDISINGKHCLENVVFHAGPGSIIVFHDSEKAFPRLEYALPRILEYFSEEGYKFLTLSEKNE